MHDRYTQAEISEAISLLRERITRTEVEVSHLRSETGVHTGQLTHMDGALAHIAWSLKDAHQLIDQVVKGNDVRDKRLQELEDKSRLTETLAKILPIAAPYLLGVLVFALTMAGKGDLAKSLASSVPIK